MSTETAQQLLNGIFLGSIYALFAVGYTLVFGVLDVLNLAHAAAFTIGGVCAYSVLAIHDGPLGLALVAALAGGAAVGVATEYLCLRPLRKRNAPPLAALVATLGLAFVIVAILEQARAGSVLDFLWRAGGDTAGFPQGSVPDGVLHVGGLNFPVPKLAIVVITVVMMVGLAYLVTRTAAGRAMRAVAENPDAARLMGIDVNRVVMLTVVGCSALAGLAGILYGVAISDISPYVGRDQLELQGLAVIVLGGMGSLVGSVVGGYLLGLIEVVALITIGANVRSAVFFMVLFAVLVVRPQGLFGQPVRERI
jgi:branched-chain amino acid transport system permease protein